MTKKEYSRRAVKEFSFHGFCNMMNRYEEAVLVGAVDKHDMPRELNYEIGDTRISYIHRREKGHVVPAQIRIEGESDSLDEVVEEFEDLFLIG